MLFQGVTGVDASGDRKPWFESGRYRVRIGACRGVTSRKGDTFYVIEGEILVVHETEVPEKMKVGRHYAQMIKFNDDMGPINTKRFVLCAMGFDPNLEETQDLVDDDAVNYSVSAEQPFAGLEMELHCEVITTRAGNPFTKHNWFPCEEMMDDPVPAQTGPQQFQGVPQQVMQGQPAQSPIQQPVQSQQVVQGQPVQQPIQQPVQPQQVVQGQPVQPPIQQPVQSQQVVQGQPVQQPPPGYPQGGQQ